MAKRIDIFINLIDILYVPCTNQIVSIFKGKHFNIVYTTVKNVLGQKYEKYPRVD